MNIHSFNSEMNKFRANLIKKHELEYIEFCSSQIGIYYDKFVYELINVGYCRLPVREIMPSGIPSPKVEGIQIFAIPDVQ